MPRKLFDRIPEKLTGDDFVKVTEFLYLFHWDESLCLFRSPHTKQFALVPYSMFITLYQHAWSAINNPKHYGITGWHKTKAIAVRANYDFLYDRMVKGQPYALLKMQETNTTGGKSDKSHALV